MRHNHQQPTTRPRCPRSPASRLAVGPTGQQLRVCAPVGAAPAACVRLLQLQERRLLLLLLLVVHGACRAGPARGQALDDPAPSRQHQLL